MCQDFFSLSKIIRETLIIERWELRVAAILLFLLVSWRLIILLRLFYFSIHTHVEW